MRTLRGASCVTSAWLAAGGVSTTGRGAGDGEGTEAIRTGANTEAKLLMLTHAFEKWGMLRVCLHTDARNLRSRAAIEIICSRAAGQNVIAGAAI